VTDKQKKKEKKKNPDEKKKQKEKKKGKKFPWQKNTNPAMADVVMFPKKTESSDQSRSSSEEQVERGSEIVAEIAIENKTLEIQVGVAVDQNSKHRKSMEDEHLCIGEFGTSSQLFAAVYDGHGGREVVELIKKHLHGNILREMKVSEPKDALKKAFEDTDNQIKEMVGQKGTSSGCTAVVAIITKHPRHRELTVANIGDSRAILCRNNKAIRLTYEHKASDEAEKQRITSLKGMVIQNKVGGVLSVTRAFGDYELKESGWISNEPHISSISLTEDDTFLILACDGLFDVLQDQHVIDAIGPESNPNNAAERLVTQALSKGTTDNVSVVVLRLN